MLTEFGLVVIGAHTGFHLKDLIYKYSNKKILLVEPVPYNYQALKRFSLGLESTLGNG